MRSPRTALVAAFLGLITLVAPSLHIAKADVIDCTFTPADITAIQAIETNPALTSSQELSQELDARKALLGRVITCAKIDAQTLQTNLQGVQVSSDATQLQSELVDKLSDAINYYDLETVTLDGAGIAGTQSIARNVLSWREANYNPLAGQVANFILWAGNQAVFSAANIRLTQIGQVVSFVEAAAPNGQLQDAFAIAQSSLQDANNQNASAKAALLQSLSPDQSLAFIQASLQSLSDSYKQFLAVSAIVGTLLPTTPNGQ